MSGLDSVTKAGKKIVEAPLEIVNEGVGLIGDGINGAVQEIAKAVDAGAQGVKSVISRPLDDISARTNALKKKLPKSGLQIKF